MPSEGHSVRLSILTLGTVQISLDNEPVSGFISDKARALLIYTFVENPLFHRREKLAGLFWPEYPEHKARHTLSQTLSNIRYVIGDRPGDNPFSFLDVSRQTVKANPHSRHWLDVSQLTTSLPPQSTNTLSTLENRIALYRGHFLEGFSLRDCPAFEEWMLLKREYLQRIARELMQRMVNQLMEKHSYHLALDYAWRLLDHDPWREDSHRLVMELLALTGQRSAALAHFEQCRQTLASDLNVEPETRTLQLYERIKANQVTPPCEIQVKNTMPALTPPTNLPAQLTPFIGRDTELAAARRYVLEENCRLLSLVGPGGVGKTRFGIALASSLSGAFSHGTFLVPLTAEQSVLDVVIKLAQTIGLTFTDQEATQTDQVIAYLKNKHMLLVLDNVEQLLDLKVVNRESVTFENFINRILETAPHLTIIVTSRIRMHMLGEVIFQVDELHYPGDTETDLDAITRYAAVQLFADCAKRVRPDFTLNEGNRLDIRNICCYVQGLPLAIQLAASWLATASAADISAQLTKQPVSKSGGLDALHTEWSNVSPRHHSMHMVFEHSWQLLPEEPRALLEKLSVFQGGFTQPHAVEVVGLSPHHLKTFVDASLMRREASGRYSMHTLMHEYSVAQLARNPTNYHGTFDRHSAYFCSLMQKYGSDLVSSDQLTALILIDTDYNNFHNAWQWAVQTHDLVRIGQALPGFKTYLHKRGLHDMEALLVTAAMKNLDAKQVLSPQASLPQSPILLVLVRLLCWYCAFIDRTEAHALLEALLNLLREQNTDTRFAQAEVTYTLGSLQPESSENARDYFQQSLALFQALGEKWHTANTLYALGLQAWHAGQYPSAQSYYEKMLRLSRESGDVWNIAEALTGLASIAFYFGNPEQSFQLSRESLEIVRKFNNHQQLALRLYTLGNKYMVMGQYDQAYDVMRQSIELNVDHGIEVGMVFSVIDFVQVQLGLYEEAHRSAALYLVKAEVANRKLEIGFSHYTLAWAALALGRYQQALDNLHQSLVAYQEIGIGGELGQTYAMLSIAHSLLGMRQDAIIPLLSSLDHCAASQNKVAIVLAIAGFCCFLIQEDNPQQVLEIFTMIADVEFIQNSKWFQDFFILRIAEATAHLTAEETSLARKNGQERNLQQSLQEFRQYLEACQQ